MTPAVADQSLPRLLNGIGERQMVSLTGHLEVHGALPETRKRDAGQIIEVVRRAGLLGHGGAAFPTALKLRAVAARRGPKVVVANGTEGEPASKKDRVLLRETPHLVLDGAALAARAVGAREAIIAIAERDERSFSSLERALEARRAAGLRGEPRFRVFAAPDRYLSGQEAALVNLLNGGEALPTFGPRPSERGVGRRPTLVQNVETLAHMSLIARHGADWFRGLGTERDPGSALVTVSGAVARPGVYEIAHGTALADLLAGAGLNDDLRAVLVGGYSGSWLAAGEVAGVKLSSEHLARYDATLGAGVVVALASTACAVAETSRIADYFAAESSGQCGPCVNGLGAIADTVQQLASGTADRDAERRLARWTAELPRRGACAHPDGAARFVASALRVFGEEFRDHAGHGACERCAHAPVLPTPISAAY
jgi:NADH:ubiquinone oxidoreductase subunit F (NADH-binding)